MAYVNTEKEDRPALEAQARDWLVRLTSGRATTDDAQAYKQWCARSPLHAQVMAETTRVWDLAKEARLLPAAPSIGPGLRGRTFSPGRRAFFGSAVAAGAAAYLVVRPPARLWPAFSDLTADYRTGTGEQRDIPLDGGMVRLNTQTAVNMHPAGAGAADAVDIELLSGEAMIALERGQALPVTVRAGGGTLRLASAARFNVRATGGDVCITCLQGRGEVDAAGRARSLEPGQQVIYGGKRFVLNEGTDLAAVESWRDRILVFDGVSLAAAIDEINRYRPGRLIVTSAALGRRKVQARLRVEQLPEVVAIIEATYGAKATVLPAGIVLLS
ncbi:FecR domain-containing protein [Pigmentiphaga sp.]|uniref:FecR family protein n=1 Tax=Pigmentiphaga sp. TaxID=1977564 RepID=UPI00128BB95E|nr:FecR domain-containing protein [Pigmentiphaga sp.]MPS30495.1 DUF4880 domain-containing protein [Alcaligenaceae bacterium SAGV5]MPS50116.1 DUF4880 domain-containing protein [Alcaligenaceae bacterium SAGV3]MPT56624.1 DUF4880 domain-containing protein [Alcaligenaceae bacterium]